MSSWPTEHCKKCVELLRAGGADERLIHAVVCHGYGLCVDVKPEHEMEKVLFACDELTGLIGACAKMRPSGSIADMDLKSLKKKYKSKGFAAGCSREVIAQGAEMLGWDAGRSPLPHARSDEARRGGDCRGGRGAVKKVHWGFAPNPGNSHNRLRLFAISDFRHAEFRTAGAWLQSPQGS